MVLLIMKKSAQHQKRISAVVIVLGILATPLVRAQTLTVLYNFTGGTDAGLPYAGAVRDNAGDLHGTTYFGGSSDQGTVFKVNTSGTETVLHSFTGGTTDGCNPDGTPAMDTNGNLYGTTQECGSSGVGIVWKLRKKRTEAVLHNFAGGSSDGANPRAGVILDAEGNLYGSTEGGGPAGVGTVFKLNTTGKETVLYSFTGGADGALPFGNLVQDTKGNLYGTTESGGSSDYYGTVWKLTP